MKFYYKNISLCFLSSFLPAFAMLAVAPANAQNVPQYQNPEYSQMGNNNPNIDRNGDYVEAVRLTEGSQIIAHVKVTESIPLKAERSPGLQPGYVRLYIEASIMTLLRGPNDMPRAIRYLLDVPRTARGKAPKLKDLDYLIFAQQGDNRAGDLLLNGDNAHQPWNAPIERQTSYILQELFAPNSPPVITGIKEAFFVPGNLQGEGESQIFLSTANGAPVSLSVISRPGLAPSWSVSFSEIVDQSGTVPQRGTLAWYRLACSLPPALPAQAAVSGNAAHNEQAERDYQFILQSLGPCR